MSCTNFARNSSISNKNSANYQKWTYTVVDVKNPLFLSNFNDSWVSRRVSKKKFKFQI